MTPQSVVRGVGPFGRPRGSPSLCCEGGGGWTSSHRSLDHRIALVSSALFGPSATTSIGVRLIRGYCSRRFPYSSASELDDLVAYMYSVSALPGSGEFALGRILSPGMLLSGGISPFMMMMMMMMMMMIHRSSIHTR